MVSADSLSASRIVRLALIGLGAAFAWIVLSLLLDFGSAQASAQEGDDESGLGAVTSLLDTTVTGVTDTVGTVGSTTTGVVDTVVEVAPAPVQAPVQEVVSTVGDVVTAVAEPVQQIADSGVVSAVVTPVVDLVQQTPFVGGIAGGLGLDDAVTELGTTVDGALSGTVSTVADAGTELATPPPGADRPDAPGTAVDTQDDATPAPGLVATAASASASKSLASGVAQARAGWMPGALPASSAPSAQASAVSSSALDAPNHQLSRGGLSSAAISSSGPGGAGLGAWALVAFAPLAAHRAWVRRAGPDDDDLPAAPPGSTDVSPD